MTLLFMGDTQRTCFLERLIGREQNDPERESIIGAAATEKADAVFFLGDLVAIGALRSQWSAFDRLIRPLTEKKIPLYGVYGNHDYFFHKARARGFMNTRFPHLEKASWDCVHFGELALVTLDSNKRDLSRNQWNAQKAWLKETLAGLESDSRIRGVILALHHPPYTNSRRSRASSAVRDEIVPFFLEARKALALISGHCHAYERFEVAGKTFIVSGGAGGARARILNRPDHRLPDLYPGGPFRPFHYLRMDLHATGAAFAVMGLEKGENAVKELDSFQLHFNP